MQRYFASFPHSYSLLVLCYTHQDTFLKRVDCQFLEKLTVFAYIGSKLQMQNALQKVPCGVVDRY